MERSCVSLSEGYQRVGKGDQYSPALQRFVGGCKCGKRFNSSVWRLAARGILANVWPKKIDYEVQV